ncbi:MAG TPA: hypothetical protein VF269_08735 [Rhodanobacteraceae bacterium]
MTPTPPSRRIGLGHGWRWFTGAWGMLRRRPQVFLLMGLTMAIIDMLSSLPLIGLLAGLFMLIAGPALLAGICMEAHGAAAGRTPNWQHLFTPLLDPARRREAIKLCIPLVIGKLTAIFMLAIVLLEKLARSGANLADLNHHPDQLIALLKSDAMRPWLFVALAIVLFAWTFTALAIPGVVLTSSRASTAMTESFRLVWHHLGAWIVAALALFVCVGIVFWLLSLTHVILIVQLGTFTLLYALLGPMLYLAWRDLGGLPTANTTPAAPKPPAPPPPSGFLEA